MTGYVNQDGLVLLETRKTFTSFLPNPWDIAGSFHTLFISVYQSLRFSSTEVSVVAGSGENLFPLQFRNICYL